MELTCVVKMSEIHLTSSCDIFLQLYESIAYAQKWNSYQYYENSINISNGEIEDDDLVVVYHTLKWENLLNEENLMSTCLLEKRLDTLLSDCNCTRKGVSVISEMFDDECNFLVSFDDSISILTSPENKYFVKDSTSSTRSTVSSEVLISYFPPCIATNRLEYIVDDLTSESSVKISYGQNDLLATAFEDALDADFPLVLLCYTVSFIVVGIHMPNKLAVLLIYFSNILAVVISVWLMEIYGYESITEYCFVVVPCMAFVSSTMGIVFSNSWEVMYYHLKYAEGSTIDISFYESVLCRTYQMTQKSMNSLWGTFFVAVLSISVSPMVAVSQFAALLSFCLACSIVMFYCMTIPSFVVYSFIFPNYNCHKLNSSDKMRLLDGRLGAELELSFEVDNEDDDIKIDEADLGEDRTMIDPEESRDIITTLNPRLSTHRQYPSLSSSSKSRSLSSPRGTILSTDMRPLATDRVVRPHFHNYKEDKGDNDDGGEDEDIDFDDDISEFTKESGMYSTSYEPSAGYFQIENPSVSRSQQNVLLPTYEEFNVPEEKIEDQKNDDNVENDQASDDLTEQNNADISAPNTLENSSNSKHQFLRETYISQCIGKCILFFVAVASLVLFFVVVKFVVKYDSTYSLFRESENLFNFMKIGMWYKTLLYSFTGSFGNSLTQHEMDFMPFFPVSVNTSGMAARFEVDVCYGLGSLSANLESHQIASYEITEFESYVSDNGLINDMKNLCGHVVNNTEELYLGTSINVEASCLYSQLEVIQANSTSSNTTIFGIIYEWMMMSPSRRLRVGVVPSVVEGGGNFGENGDYDLAWLCESFVGDIANTDDFFSRPDLTHTLAYRWVKAVEDSIGLHVHDGRLPVILTSDAWMPVEIERVVQLRSFYTIFCMVVGCFVILLVLLRDLKLALLIEVSSVLLTLTTLLVHTLVFDTDSGTTLTGVTAMYVLFSFCMISQVVMTLNIANFAHANAMHSFTRRFHDRCLMQMCGFQLANVVGMTTVLLFTEFSLLHVTAEYILVMCVVSCLYSFFILPIFVKSAATIVANPVVKYFQPLPPKKETADDDDDDFDLDLDNSDGESDEEHEQ